MCVYFDSQIRKANKSLTAAKSGETMNNPEIILNLWAIHDPDDNVIYGLAGRAYFAGGTDEQKLALLKQLAVSDFVMALRMPVPERFSIESGSETVPGLCSL